MTKFNGLTICALLLAYNYNSGFITTILSKIDLLNHTTIILVVGLCIFLKILSFEVSVNCSISYGSPKENH